MVTLGDKIRGFRRNANLSQFNMETDLGLAYGSLSRIESGHTTPTRVTVCKIADYLKLNDRQFDYLIGSRSNSPTEKEINQVISSTSDIWNDKNLLVVLRDDHYRVCAVSSGMKLLLGITEDQWLEECYLHNIISVMLNQKLPFYKAFDPALNPNAEQDLTNIIIGFYYEMNFMREEPDYKDTANMLMENPYTRKIWETLNKTKKYPLYFLITRRQLKLFLHNKTITLIFYTEVLPDSTRFSFIHFIPKPVDLVLNI